MRKVKMFLVMLLCTCLLAGSIELPVLATEADVTEADAVEQSSNEDVSGGIDINPLYAEWTTEEEIAAWAQTVPRDEASLDSEIEVDGLNAALDFLIDQMVAREEVINITVNYEEFGNSPSYDAYVLLRAALEEMPDSTGTEGDYLKCHYRGSEYSVSIDYSQTQATFSYVVYYLTTKEQEAMVTQKLEQVYDSLNLDAYSGEAKIGKIYDYITNSVTYDYEHVDVGASVYPIAWSAYGGLIDGTCVCQGYASLTYRMLKENGISNRVIAGYSGEAHAWNIVEIDGLYYNIDSTWDGYTVDENGNVETPGQRNWYLLSTDDFTNHTRNGYDTRLFHLTYPMAAVSYGKTEVEKTEYPEQDNLAYTFQTTSGASVSTTANAGECTILVIGRSNCGYTKAYVDKLKTAGLGKSDYVRILMVDIDQSLEIVSAYEESLACEDITVCYGKESDGSAALWAYAGMGGFTGGTLYFPTVALIDGNNKVRYVENSARQIEPVKDCLRSLYHYPTPAIQVTNVERGDINLAWNAVEGATQYHLYMKSKEKAEFVKIQTLADTAYLFNTQGDFTYYFAVSADFNGIESEISEPVIIPYEEGAIKEVTLSADNLSLFSYQSEKVTVKIVPVLKGDYVDSAVIWSSSDTGVATVQDGKITAVKPGTAVITATSEKDATKKASCTVTVKNDYTISYELNGGTLTTPNPTAYNPYYPELTLNIPEKRGFSFAGWYRDKDFAENTRMDRIPKGSDYGNFTLYAKWVEFEAPVISETEANKEGITIRWNEVAKADAYHVYRKTKTESAYTKLGRTEETSYQDAVTTAGTYQYVVTAEYDGVESGYSPAVEVQYAYGAVKEVVLSKKEATIFAYEEITLEATVSPVMSDDSIEQDVTWASSNAGIATVKDGKITGVKAGSAVITATSTKDATKKATCTVTVKKDYTIRYELNGGTLIEANPAAYNPFYPDLTLHAPVKDDCTFLGWYTDAAFAEESKMESIPTGTDLGDLVLYAKWKEKMAVAAPTAQVPSFATVEKGVKIRLSTETLDATIYYTLDGTNPTRDSIVYTDAIVINETTLIYAFAVKDGLKDSAISIFHYVVKDEAKDLGDVLPEDVPENGIIPEGLWVAGVEDVVYDGNAVTFDLNVYHGKKLLTAGTDYTVAYKNNKLAAKADAKKAPSVIVTGKGNYKDKIVKTFTIEPVNIATTPGFYAETVSVPFNGKVQKPVPAVYNNSTKLKAKKDFVVQYPDATPDAYKAVGSYEITVEGTGNYCGSLKSTLVISQVKQVSKLKVTAIPAQPYTGKEITPVVEVKDGKTVVDASQYTVQYRNNIEVGTASISIVGDGVNYVGVKTVRFKITGRAIAKAKLQNLAASIPYTGKEVIQEAVTLSYTEQGQPSELLVKDRDYTVKYLNNKKVGTATVLFEGMGKYTGTLKKTFKIVPYNISTNTGAKIEVTYEEVVPYAKGGAKAEPTVRFDGKLLTEGRDYTVSYKNNKALFDGSGSAKAPTMIIKGKGSFKGSINLTYQIMKQNFSFMEVRSADKPVSTKKGAFKSVPKVYDLDGKLLKAGVDYEKNIKYVYDEDTVLTDGTFRAEGSELGNSDMLPVGCVIRVEVTGKGNYYATLAYGKYRVVKADISKATVKVEPQTYTGKAVEPGKDQISIVLKGVKLSESDYEIVSYSNNVKKGTATVVIRGVGNYGGTKTVKFKISAKTVKETEFYNF